MMKSLVSERGQVLVIIALAIIGLVGITGLAIDGSMILADRRHAQNAADTAALAGALDRIQTLGAGMPDADSRASMRIAAWDRADENGYTQPSTSSSVEVYLCDEPALGADCPEPYSGDSDYVQVIITSNVETFFARVLGIEQLHNRVVAVALADDDDTGPLFDGRSIVALNPDCPSNGSLIVSGDSLITINGGGMWANADEACAFKCTSTSVEVEIPDGGISSPSGGFDSVSEHCEAELTDDGFNLNDKQIPYPPELPVLNEPAECDPSVTAYVYAGTWTDSVDGTTVNASFLTPGYYGTFPPKKDSLGNNLRNHIVMEPGVYCAGSVVKLVDQNIHLYGENVTIWIREGNGFTINGGIVQLYGSDPDYPGYLIIVEPDYDGAVTACTMEGNALNEYVGAIYAPHCDVTINGTADTPPDGIDAQIIGYNVTINGNANLTINYDDDNNPAVVDPPKIGQAK